MGFYEQLANEHPELKRKLIMAKMKMEPADYVKKTVVMSVLIAATFAITYFLFTRATGLPILITPLVFIVFYFLMYMVLFHVVDVRIRKIAKDIDREVLFAGRFLLVKLNAGRPLIIALQEASEAYGVANKYFKEIVHEIDIGTPLEDAIAKASRYSPSDKFRRILFQISNALRIGVDVTNFLESILDEIAEEQLMEIQRYGKKLNGLTMFYMLFSIVIPSLGITLFITVISMLSVEFDMVFFTMLAGALAVLGFFFITLFRSIRPTVNI